MKPEDALQKFVNEVPALGLLGTPYFVKPDTPLEITPDVQFVCKYLKAYDDENSSGKKRIDTLHPVRGEHR